MEKIFYFRNLLALCIFISFPVVAQKANPVSQEKQPESSASGNSHPSGREIYERGLEAAGGRKALSNIQNRVIHATQRIQGKDTDIHITIWRARGNKFLSRVEMPKSGIIERGCDGKIAWSNDPQNGPRILAGQDKKLPQMSAMDELYFEKIFSTFKYTGEQVIEGEPCYEVTLAGKDVPPLIVYYSKKDYRMRKAVTMTPGPYGMIKTATFFHDYRKVDDVFIPFETVRRIGNVVISLRIDKITQNTKLPADTFALPDEIKALLKSRNTTKQSKQSTVVHKH